MTLGQRIFWWWARRNMCRLRGHAWSGGMYTDGLFHIRCERKRCRHMLTEREAIAGEPKRYKLPWGDTRKVNGRLYE